MKRTIYFGICAIALIAFAGSALVGEMLGQSVLHPQVRPLTLASIQSSKLALQEIGAVPEDFLVKALDGVVLRGWKVSSAHANGDWVLLYHGQSDNRTGMIGQATLLLRHGYGVVMMDSRAHGESGGNMATYGYLERQDTRAIIDAMDVSEKPQHIYALGSSMGAAIALQSAAVESRIDGVVAESSFSDLREASNDYAGLHWSSWLGKTLFRPGTWTVISTAQKEGHFLVEEVSPEKSVSVRPFAVLLICDGADTILPCRHSQRIYRAAAGPKELWELSRAQHASAIGAEPAEYERRVLGFLDHLRQSPHSNHEIAFLSIHLSNEIGFMMNEWPH
ncbi:MAG TPA: alpha/beta hydrolase [Candidatus Saccharimonadales bacterium]|jgi:alpha-beta hydrolase superfamily lysophospholipase|nr:alpha/beta hydrolase [Candidatus Saccharimonadales bacterium]